MKIGVAVSLESNDVLVTVKEGAGITVSVKSIVYDFFKNQIEKVITDTLSELAQKCGGEYYTWEVQGAEPM